MRVFFFGVGYCARRLIAREPWIEASGTARTAERVAALRGEGVEAYAFDGARRGAGARVGASERGGDRRLDPAARRDGRGARALRVDDRRAPPCDACSTIRRSAFTATTAARGSTRRARRGRARRADWRGLRTRRAGRLRPGLGGSKRTSCASPAFTGPAATRSSICARATRGGSSSRARCSTAPMSTTSPRSRASCSRAGSRARSGTSPTKSRPRRRTSSPMPRRCSASTPPPEEPFEEARLSPMAREFLRRQQAGLDRQGQSRPGISPRLSDLPRGPQALADAGEGQA